MLADRLPIRKGVARHAAAMACALIVLVSGYLAADFTTNAALDHYARVRTARLTDTAAYPVLPTAIAEEESAAEKGDSSASARSARPAIDSTFSERTIIWANLFEFWREHPKYLVIGNGMHRTGSLLVKNTMNNVDAVAVHNMYLQFIADYGIIGFAMLAAFLALLVPRALRVFFARAPESSPGARVFVMIVVAQLLTGLMESQPLAPATAPNLALFFSLAVLYSLGDRQTHAAPLS